jgi:hypothetical protein
VSCYGVPTGKRVIIWFGICHHINSTLVIIDFAVLVEHQAKDGLCGIKSGPNLWPCSRTKEDAQPNDMSEGDNPGVVVFACEKYQSIYGSKCCLEGWGTWWCRAGISGSI